ncbi:MAG: hypothetical protein U0168_09070 [Nannocystaceae bacterium]
MGDGVAAHRTAADVVVQSAGRRHEHRRPVAQRPSLARDVAAAGDHLDAHVAQPREQPVQLLPDLHRELARGRDHDRQRAAGRRGIAERTAEHQPQRDGLARAGLRRDAKVAIGRLGRQHGALHRRQRVEAPRPHRVAQARVDRRIIEVTTVGSG